MKLSLLILLVSFIRVSASVYSQQTKMSISLHHTSVHEVLKYIENQSEFFFLYKNSSIDDTRMIDIDVRNKSIDYILRQIFKGTKISYKIVDRQIVLMEEEDSEANRQKQQQKTITGIVTDSKGQVLPGVSVIEKNTNNGTMTDTSGRYTIKVSSDNSFLVFSFMGMKTIELAVAGKTEINVVMETGQVALDELVVIGYGSIRKKDLTGSVATVGVQDFQQGPITNAEQLIANKIPGVQITPISGKPGAGSSFLIRGGASLNASNDPLIVIDGVPIEGWGSGPGFLSSLNPDDIESFSILKDASAAAIYGSRASNGVILITTNKGAKGPLKFDFLVKTSLSTLFKKVPVLSADQYRQAAQEAATYTGKSFESLGLGNANTDWQDEIYQPALGTEYNLSVSGGLKKLPYRLSASYLNQDGILKTGNFKRTSVTLNLNPVLLQNHLKVNVNLKGASEKEQIADTRAISSAISFDPTQPVTTPDSHFGGYFEYEQYASNPANLHGHLNPVGMLEQESSKNNALRSIGNIQIDYIVHFLPDIHVNINTGYDMSTSKNSYYLPATAFEQNIALGSVYNADPAKKVSNTFFESYLNYVKEFKLLKSRVDAIVGYSYNNFLTTVYNYPTYNVNNQEQPNTEPAYPYDKPHHSLISFYGRLNYSFNNKYLLTATVRDDGSSRFSENNRWGVFPSFALAWKLNEESFLKNVKTISELKLRMGYGVTGQQDGIGNYDYLPMYTLGDNAHKYLIGNQFYQISSPSAADRNRKWEQTATTNIALDFGLFNGRISGSLDIYYKKTKDLLNTVNVPLGTDFTSSITKNIGSMENKGVEFNLKTQPVHNNNIIWDVGFNISYNENKITKLSFTADSSVGLTSGSYLVNTVGYSRNVFYLYHQVYDKSGYPLEETMLDTNNDGVINEKDRYRSKSSTPKVICGFSTNLTYKNWSAGMTMHANLGQYIYYRPNDNLVAVYGWIVPYNLNKMYYDSRFKMSGDQAQNYSDYYLQNASFLKLDNINVGYNLGKIFRSFKNDAALRISLDVRNVLTITKYTGQDPEASYNWGIDWGSNYSIPRIYSVQMDLSF